MRSRSQLDPEKASDPAACREAALRLLDYRWRGEKELERKLKDRGFEQDAIHATLATLKAARWLDDDRFAKQFARSRVRKGIGTLRIRRELETMGVESERIVPAVKEAVVEEDEQGQLARICARKMRAGAQRHGASWAGSDAARKKIIGFLLNRGYDYAAAQRAYAEELGRIGAESTPETELVE